MNYFLDSNVIIGYSICIDKWHESAKNVFSKGKTIYWSPMVKQESLYKIKKLIDKYNFIFKEIEENIDEGIVQKEYFFKKIKSLEFVENPFQLSEILWTIGRWYEEVHSQELLNFLEELTGILYKSSQKRYFYCTEYLVEHIRKDKYEKILNSFNSLKNENFTIIHYPDNEILLDAHDLANTGKEIEFVTSDKKLLEFKKNIIELTQINKMTFIEDIN